MLTPYLPAVLAAATVLAALPAQALNESRGPLAGAATAVLVEGGLGGTGNDAQTRVRRNGFANAPTMPLPAIANAPNLQAILAFYGAPGTLRVDDISTGRDDLPVDADGTIHLWPDSWAVLSFSLTPQAQGLAGSRIAEQRAEGGVGAALFSWILPSSSHLPPEVIGRVDRSHSPRELGLPITPTIDVDGLDFPLVLGLDQQFVALNGELVREPGFAALIEDPQEIYFTVSHATRGLVPIAWWGGFSAPLPPSGATILRVRRMPQGAGWTQPQVFLSYAALGLGQDEDIDALAYDSVRQNLLFSTVGTLHDQFLFAYLGTDVVMVEPLKKPDGMPVGGSIGKAQNDDVDAVCTLDPTLRSNGMPPPVGDDFGSSCGSPRLGVLGTPPIGGSAYRRYEGGVVHFDSFMVGWPPVAGAAPGFAAAFLTSEDNYDLVLIDGVKLRDFNNVIPGDPQSVSVVVPPAMVLHGMRFTFRWAAIDAATGELAEAQPVQVNL